MMRYKLNSCFSNCFYVTLALTFPVFASGFMLDKDAPVQSGNQTQVWSKTTGITLLPTTGSAVESSTAMSVCQDTVDICSMYGRTACTQKVYEAWAKAHCAMYCGFCTPPVPVTSLCENKIANCEEYDSGNLCTDDSYYSWAYENCRGYCKFGICNDTDTDTACEDRNGTDCKQLNATVNICDDIPQAKTTCRKYCDLCNATDGAWCPWGTWSACDVTCGNGTQSKSRQCACDAPANGGLDCPGDSKMTIVCPVISCPVDGSWSSWASWEGCSVTCGIGLQRRDRTCSNPYPGLGGNPCLGDTSEDRICFNKACADGGWSSWSDWSTCSATCLGGLSKRTRLCNNPSPSTFGHDCIGNNEGSKICNAVPCQEFVNVGNGQWTTWSSWSACDFYCVKERTRHCTGRYCSGNSEIKENCDLLTCSLDLRVRLAGENTFYRGRVEVSYDGVNWGTVCGGSFNRNNNGAKVVCSMLGYSTSHARLYNVNGGSGPIYLEDVACTGSESSLLFCKHHRWNTRTCDHSKDVGVSCV
ncbi:coadhesin-like [Mercenaria mercenaria]|uniref:coadhesin-like n=1 Tax=Mercenaria mercenaria TaxID=6596 RepID=UPI00234F74FE|nr:coadhesin-like [Mercenaria mercenaria]